MLIQYSKTDRTDSSATSSRNEEPQVSRIRDKVRDRAALIGQTRPAPLILIDALPGKGAQ